MAKTNVRIDIPSSSPDDLIAIAVKLEKTHKDRGASSPLSGIDMATFSEKLKSAMEKREEAKRLREQAEALSQQAILDLGISKTQNSKTPGTIYNLITSARDVLLGLNRGHEEKLNEWGFKVVSGTSAPKTKTV